MLRVLTGAIFGAAQAAGNLGGIEASAETICAVAERIAKGNAQKAEAGAVLRAAIANTTAGHGVGNSSSLRGPQGHSAAPQLRGRPRCKR